MDPTKWPQQSWAGDSFLLTWKREFTFSHIYINIRCSSRPGIFSLVVWEIGHNLNSISCFWLQHCGVLSVVPSWIIQPLCSNYSEAVWIANFLLATLFFFLSQREDLFFWQINTLSQEVFVPEAEHCQPMWKCSVRTLPIAYILREAGHYSVRVGHTRAESCHLLFGQIISGEREKYYRNGCLIPA